MMQAEWWVQVSSDKNFAGLIEGSYAEVFQGHICPGGPLGNVRREHAVWALRGPYTDPDQKDTFYGVESYWADENDWLLVKRP